MTQSEEDIRIKECMDMNAQLNATIKLLNNPASVSLLSGDRKPQIRF